MFTLTPNYDYESQTEECKRHLNKHDFNAVCDLIQVKCKIKRKYEKLSEMQDKVN